MTGPAPGAFSVMAETGTNEEGKVWSVHTEAAAEMVMVGSANTKRGLSGRGLGRAPRGDETETGPAGMAVCLTRGIQQAWGKCKSTGVSLDSALEPVNLALDGAESASVSVSRLLGL